MTLSLKAVLLAALLAAPTLQALSQEKPYQVSAEPLTPYHPSEAVQKAQEDFEDAKFGIFIHWGLYSMFGQGEWYLNYGPTQQEYAKSARGFYPADFDAKAWVKAIKDAGARYVTFTSRHHDGFSMWHTAQSPYNIVDATPYGRDILRQLVDECHAQGIKVHLYYSHIDWGRDDYPAGRTGRTTGKDPSKADYEHYYQFMNNQIRELMTQYGPIDAMWFDGVWDRDEDPEPFDWHLRQQYDMIHQLNPACLVANNHHNTPFPGEDIQIFERDLPGDNSYGLSGQAVGHLPLETCATMNGMWGYRIKDQDYKDLPTLVRLLVGAAGRGANLLLNVGPQPSGAIPDTALERMHQMGEWLRQNGRSVYGTRRGDFPPQTWGTSTRRGDTLFVHVLQAEAPVIYLPLKDTEVVSAVRFGTKEKVKFQRADSDGYTLDLGRVPDEPDHIVELVTRPRKAKAKK